jgi:hypothetical protein
VRLAFGGVNDLNARNKRCLLSLSAVVFAFVSAPALSEILELEGNVKAVDAADRTLSVERKTPKGNKTLELEVTKKAGDLSSLKVGDRITFSYDPDLEIVTKLGSGDAGEETASEKKRCRVTFSISEMGDCMLRVQRAPPAASETSRVQQKDGTWVCQQAFDQPSDIKVFEGPYGPILNVRVNRNNKCLSFEPAQVKGTAEKTSEVVHPQKFRVPFEVSVDLAATGNRFLFFIQYLPTQSGQRHPVVTVKSGDAFADKVTVEMACIVRDAQGAPSAEAPLVEETSFSLEEPWEKRFRLPVPNVRSRDAYVVRLGAKGESAVEMDSLTLTGLPLPSVGIKLGEKNGVVFAESVVSKSLAERAGIESGDVISAIRGKPATSGNEAVELLSNLPFGESSEITIQRGDSKKTIRVTPTFDK